MSEEFKTQIPDPEGAVFGIDPLVQCLVLFTQLYHKPFTAEALMAGLPIPRGEMLHLYTLKSSKGLFARAASRAGLKSTLVKRRLSDISALQLPMILLLKNSNACILHSISDDQQTYKVILPAEEAVEEIITYDALEKDYTGYAFLIKKPFVYDEHDSLTLNVKNKHWFWDTIKLSKGIYRDVIYATVLVNLFVLASPLFTMSVYNRVIPNDATETLWVFASGVFVVYILDTFLKFTRAVLLESAGKKSDIIMSSIIFEKVLDLKMASHPKSVGSFASNLKDFDMIRSFLTNATLTALVDFPFAILFLLVIGYIGGWIVLIPITMMLLILIYALFLRIPLRDSIEETHKASAVKSSILIEALQNIETLKTLGTSGQVQWAWEEATGEIAQKSLKSRLLSTSITTITGFLMQLTTIITVIVGVYLIGAHELSMGGLIAVIIIASRTVAPMGQVAALIANYSDAKTAYDTIDGIISQPLERPYGKVFITRQELKGEILFTDVSFAYDNSEHNALKDVSFSIKPGEKVGIIGRNGSGKSTLAKLLLNLYEPQSGSILMDGIDIKQIDPADLRKNISYVAQDITLFKGNVRDNIVYRNTRVSDEQMIRASVISGADEFIRKHPQGYEMPIGERGMGLSGGQRQSIGIARALLFESPIVIMDEPSNAMDQLSENRLLANLKTYLLDKTAIIITQKNTALSLVDRIIVMENGKIYMDGPKDQVIAKLSGGNI
ncbi:type I secretion system permease/ATPase [Sulfuricurvum sp.]|uniref:type I secretion system permease/ATPase n=1 Tax=Sulfuricurvum sp. TaxID=2025608 RepID=UPI002611CF3E|nr:type I secretion system permease/ATPase [Sulfuricurvum sp.]MDD2267399.1 type I secretion system permease/ATPase [Sulfuricurvum sp.]MDD2783078.1 type I secretion system permease/ATPase [Sulfuricurvum sp.]